MPSLSKYIVNRLVQKRYQFQLAPFLNQLLDDPINNRLSRYISKLSPFNSYQTQNFTLQVSRLGKPIPLRVFPYGADTSVLHNSSLP